MTVTEEKTEGRSPKRKRDWKGLFTEWGIGLAAVAALTFICNIIGYSGGFLEAVPGRDQCPGACGERIYAG